MPSQNADANAGEKWTTSASSMACDEFATFCLAWPNPAKSKQSFQSTIPLDPQKSLFYDSNFIVAATG
jgi:hypothetical protein